MHNDLTFTWRIFRKEGDTLTLEDFSDKTVEVVLYDHRHVRATISHITILVFYAKLKNISIMEETPKKNQQGEAHA